MKLTRKPKVRLAHGSQPSVCWLPLKMDGSSPPPRSQMAARREDHQVVSLHRHFYEELSGPVPEGRLLHHECQRHNCVNPHHLVPMTHDEHGRCHGGLLPPSWDYRLGLTADPRGEVA